MWILKVFNKSFEAEYIYIKSQKQNRARMHEGQIKLKADSL